MSDRFDALLIYTNRGLAEYGFLTTQLLKIKKSYQLLFL